MRRDVLVVGGGHNGLVAACYLARVGLDVEVVDRDTVLGGAVSTVERWPGVRVDRGSSLHVMVRHTGIVEELDLTSHGLEYVDVDPWAVSWHGDEALRFGVNVDDTCASIEAVCGDRDATAYAGFVAGWQPRVDAMLTAFHAAPTPLALGRAFWPLGRKAGRAGGVLAREFLQSADTLLDAQFGDERLRAALAWWAAQAGPPPHEPGTAPLVATALLMHRRPPGRPVGGSGMLTVALGRRLEASGGSVRLGDGVVRLARHSRGWTAHTASGERIDATTVVSACHVATLAELLGDEPAAHDLAHGLRVGTGMGMVLRVLTDRLPPYSVDVDGAHAGMQLLAPTRHTLRAAYADYLRGDPPGEPPLLLMTPTATDPSLAPEGRHVVTVWTQWHPRHPRDGSWESLRHKETERLVRLVDRYAPGFEASVVDTLLQTPEDLERELDLRGGNVMHLDMTLDAMFALRPHPSWSAYRAPLPGLYLCGASTHPGGGVSGASGRSAARTVLADQRRRVRRRSR